MTAGQILRIYLDDESLARAKTGDYNIINRIRQAFERQGFRVELRRNSDAERLKSAARRGYSLFHMDEPFHARALTLRRAYFYPFWRIEASAKRWEWEIAKTDFRPEAIDPAAATAFCNAWRKRLFGKKADNARRDGYVYIPLQGRLLDRRSFQSASPVEMIQAVLDHETTRKIAVGFHPNESYSEQEKRAVETLASKHPRLSIATADMADLLSGCDYVVTENSSVALSGYFFHKPAILFARIDFHHIAVNAAPPGVERAFEAIHDAAPAFDAYLYWFLKLTAINGGSDQAEAQILDIVRRRGWQV